MTRVDDGATALGRSATTSAGWLRAGGLSCGVHAMALLGIGIGIWVEKDRPGGRAPSLAEAVTTVDLSVLDDWPVPDAPPAPTPIPASPANETGEPAHPSAAFAPLAPGAPERHPVAPDRGDGQGRPIEDVAWRRDNSTLHDRLTDGSSRYQPAHTRTAAHAVPASPQAVRREPTVAGGDSPRSSRVTGAPPSTVPGMPDEAATARGGQAAEAVPEPPAPLAAAVPATGPVSASFRQGQLDAERGQASFDVERLGAASDDRNVRAASNEAHPSVTDLSAPATPGVGEAGRGPAVAVTGGAAHSTTGVAPAAAGFLGSSQGVSAESAARERSRAQYHFELRGRVNRALVWPRALAIRLEQGETMVVFSLAPDGQVAGPVLVTKSAGFDEFDRAAVDAVRRAAPFPRLPRELSKDPSQPVQFSLRVTFSNPVIR